MDKNTQQPVDNGPWLHGITGDMKPRVFVGSDDFAHDVRLYVDGDFSDTAERIAYAKVIASQLNAAPPVPRDVLMAALGELRDRCAGLAAKYINSEAFIRSTIDMSAIADRYADKVQPEPVNQQTLAALKLARKKLEDEGYFPTSEIDSAIDVAEAVQPGVTVCLAPKPFLKRHDGWYFVDEVRDEYGPYPSELDAAIALGGFLQAYHTNPHAQQPASAQPVAVPDNLLARLEHHMRDKENTAFARSTMRELHAMLSAAPKSAGKDCK